MVATYNKKRTILTLLGIALSLALISAIEFFLKSGRSSQLDQAERTLGSAKLNNTAYQNLVTPGNPLAMDFRGFASYQGSSLGR